MAETATAAPEAPETGSKKKLFLIIGIVVALLGGAAAWFLVLAPGGEEATIDDDAPLFAAEPGEVVQVAEATVSLGGDPPRFAMITYSAVLSVDATADMVSADLARMRSQAQVAFRGKDADALHTEAGFLALQDELTAVAHQVWPDGEVVEVLIESLLVQ